MACDPAKPKGLDIATYNAKRDFTKSAGTHGPSDASPGATFRGPEA